MISGKANSHATASRPLLITFSGIDGAGKTTQIEHLSRSLQRQGLRVLRLSFWDNVAVWSKIRAGVGQQSLKFGQSEQTAEPSFTPKTNKSVRKWYLSAARSGFYLLDVARLRRLLAHQPVSNSDVVIFDRYIYDQIANIYSQSLASRIYARILLKLTPLPDLAFVVDASPAAAFARKPEYPLEFVHRNRQNFLRLRELAPQLVVISEATEEDVTSEIYSHVSRTRQVTRALAEETTEVSAGTAVGLLQSSCRVRNHPTANV
jgi:thymidylate kinase